MTGFIVLEIADLDDYIENNKDDAEAFLINMRKFAQYIMETKRNHNYLVFRDDDQRFGDILKVIGEDKNG